MFDYVFAKGDGNKGASYKPTWKPDWRLPPGVNGKKVILQVVFGVGLAAIPVWLIPKMVAPPTETAEKKKDVYMVQKQKAREERMRWIQSDDMPAR